jgi:hypothetical protein
MGSDLGGGTDCGGGTHLQIACPEVYAAENKLFLFFFILGRRGGGGHVPLRLDGVHAAANRESKTGSQGSP